MFTWQRFILPNTTLWKTPRETISEEPKIRHEVELTIELKDDLQKIKQILRESVNTHADIIDKDNTYVSIDKIQWGDVLIKVYFYSFPKWQERNVPQLLSDVRVIILQTLKQNSLSVPYPQLVLDIKQP